MCPDGRWFALILILLFNIFTVETKELEEVQKSEALKVEEQPGSLKEPATSATEEQNVIGRHRSTGQYGNPLTNNLDLYSSGDSHPYSGHAAYQHAGYPGLSPFLAPGYAQQHAYHPSYYNGRYDTLPYVGNGGLYGGIPASYPGIPASHPGIPYPVRTPRYPYEPHPRYGAYLDPYDSGYHYAGYYGRHHPLELNHYGSQNSLYGRIPYHGYGIADNRSFRNRYAYDDYSGYNRGVPQAYLHHRGGQYDNSLYHYGLGTTGAPAVIPPGQIQTDDRTRLYLPEASASEKDLINKQGTGPIPSRVYDPRVQGQVGPNRYAVRRRFDRTLNRLYNSQEAASTESRRDDIK